MSPEAQASAPHAEGPHEKRLILQRPPQCGGSYAIRIGIVGVGATGRSLVDFRRRAKCKKFLWRPPGSQSLWPHLRHALPPSWPERNSHSQKGDRVVWGSSPALSQHPPVLDTSDISGALTYLRSRSTKTFLIHRHRAEHGSQHFGRNQIG